MGVLISPPLVTLALGCGEKQSLADYGVRRADGTVLTEDEIRLLTLDANPDVHPQMVCRLGRDPIPMADDSVGLAIAIHLLEHIGQQGDTREWFYFWEELYRVMAPNGAVQFECPYHSSLWAWADPTHVRGVSEMTFLYFNQDAYRAPGSAIPRFRIRADFHFAVRPDTHEPHFELFPDWGNPAVMAKEPISHIKGLLIARKPLRPWWEDPR